MRIHRLPFVILALVLPTAGCGQKDFGPLHAYNDSWSGDLRFEGRSPMPLEADVYVTGRDEAEAGATPTVKAIYADLMLDERRIAATGRASHADTRDVHQTVYTSEEGREFVEIDLAGEFVIPASNDPVIEARRDLYVETYRAVLNDAGLDAAKSTVSLVGEKKGDLIEGVVVVRDLPPGGSGQITRRTFGVFSLRRAGAAPGTVTDERQVETSAFIFRTEGTSSGWSYVVMVK